VVKYEVDVIVLGADGDSSLARLETEAATEFEKESLYVVEESRLQIAFRIALLLSKTDKFQYIWVTDQL